MSDVTIDRAPSLGFLPAQRAASRNAEIIPMSLRTVHFVMPGGALMAPYVQRQRQAENGGIQENYQ